MKKSTKKLNLDIETVRALDRAELTNVAGGGSLSTPCTCNYSCLGGCTIGCPSVYTDCASCYSAC